MEPLTNHGLTKKTFSTSRSLTYTYYILKGDKPNLPALLFTHGWPDDAHLWTSIVPALLPLGFTLVIPDLLGYGGTSKPTDPAIYNFRDMSRDMIELVDSEGLGQVIPVGHDWGSMLAQRVVLFHPDRCAGLIILNVAYRPPSDEPLDLEKWNEMLKQLLGYGAFEYWFLFGNAEGARLLSQHPENVYHAIHGADPENMKNLFCYRDAFKKYLENNEMAELAEYAKEPKLKEHMIGRFKKDGFDAPQCWYRAAVDNVQYEVEKNIPKENYVIKVPVLFVGCSRDAVCLTAAIYPVQPLLPNLTIKEIDSGHWCTYENPKAVGETLFEWLRERYPGQASL